MNSSTDQQNTVKALQLIEMVPQVASTGALLDLLSEVKGYLGAQHAVFVSFIRDDDSIESFRFLLSADPRWCLMYQQQQWFASDAWLAYAASNSEPVSDKGIAYRTKAQLAARKLAEDFGCSSAFIVPAPSSGGLSRVGLLVLGTSTAGYFDSDRPGIRSVKVMARALSMELHEWWLRQARKEMIEAHRVSEDDLRLLQLEREGRGTKEIASELSMSEGSVNARFQRLNGKLGVPNRKAAARLAAEYGLITA